MFRFTGLTNWRGMGVVTPFSGRAVRRLFVLVILLSLCTSPLSGVSADSGWDSALDEIHNLYTDYTGLQATLKSDLQRNQELRKQNNAALAAVNKQLQATNAAQLAKLKAASEAVQKKHAPLLDQYTALSKQITAARKVSNLKSATVLELKRNKLKAAATAARAEVKKATSALAEAKALTAAKNKPAKDALAPITLLKKQIAAQNKLFSAAQSERTEADKRYKAAVQAGDATQAAAAMKLSYNRMKEIRTMAGQLYGWEQQISTALRAAELKLPK
ncbi:hypothetical protein C173_24762 [Paenibacillus sp. FSL R7-277]|uniref:hypothetical protein n=1 Tax=Paenibacillus sp. FSL R7-277 TaxID=1227352 RepID=UPI0003E2C68D|nr:hypothetical protein [Paenibacillus sp. FSL R7-277]ETT63566.1 hypothetical protein C173_24762 [Paenibacillus sp. FSL R7-277]